MMDPNLFIEGVRMRPSAENVLLALAALDGEPHPFPLGNTIADLAGWTGLSRHLVRARLCDLRRLGLVESGTFSGCKRVAPRYAHALTTAGARRAKCPEPEVDCPI